MTDPPKAASGQPMNDEFWQRAYEKADAGFDPSRLRRRVGRPPLGTVAAALTAVQLPDNVRQALDARAAQEHTTAGEVIRRALAQYLGS